MTHIKNAADLSKFLAANKNPRMNPLMNFGESYATEVNETFFAAYKDAMTKLFGDKLDFIAVVDATTQRTAYRVYLTSIEQAESNIDAYVDAVNALQDNVAATVDTGFAVRAARAFLQIAP